MFAQSHGGTKMMFVAMENSVKCLHLLPGRWFDTGSHPELMTVISFGSSRYKPSSTFISEQLVFKPGHLHSCICARLLRPEKPDTHETTVR